MANKYLTLDVETCGVEPSHSLLTFYIGILDENFVLRDELDVKCKPDNGNYLVTAQALGVNQINLVEHDKVAKVYSSVSTPLYGFLSHSSDKGAIKLIPIGHNISFDIKMMQKHLLSKKVWDNFVSYRTLDTGCVGQFLIAAGLIDGTKTTGSLESLVNYFGIQPNLVGYEEPKLHDARYDTLITVAVLKAMMNLLHA